MPKYHFSISRLTHFKPNNNSNIDYINSRKILISYMRKFFQQFSVILLAIYVLIGSIGMSKISRPCRKNSSKVVALTKIKAISCCTEMPEAFTKAPSCSSKCCHLSVKYWKANFDFFESFEGFHFSLFISDYRSYTFSLASIFSIKQRIFFSDSSPPSRLSGRDIIIKHCSYLI